MNFAASELRQITGETWQIVLGEAIDTADGPMKPAELSEPIAACAQITGDWQLAVVLHCPLDVARHAATVMFGTAEEDEAPEDVQDAMCELINIIAGNVKGILNGSTQLSLPNLIKGQDFKLMFPRHVPLSETRFTCRGEPVLVTLLGEEKLAARLRERGDNGAV